MYFNDLNVKICPQSVDELNRFEDLMLMIKNIDF